MLRKMNWANILGEAISITAAFVLIAVSVLSFNIGLSGAHYEEVEPEEKKPVIEEENFDIPDPCANLVQDGWWLVDFEHPQPGTKDCPNDASNPARHVAPIDQGPCGGSVLVRNTDEPYMENDICARNLRDL